MENMPAKGTPEFALGWLDFCFEKLEDVEMTTDEDEEMQEWAKAIDENLEHFKDEHDKGGLETVFLFLEPIRQARHGGHMTREQEQMYQQLLARLKLQLPKIERLGVNVPSLLKEQIIEVKS